MKPIILSILLIFISSQVMAHTLPPEPKPSTMVMQQSLNANSDTSGFTYPSTTHLESEAIIHDVVFFYPPEMLEVFGGDHEKMVDYVLMAVDANNHAFRRQDIALRRNIAGIVAMPSKPNFNVRGGSEHRMADLRRLYNDSRHNFRFFYDTSYVVALTPHIPDAVNSIGAGEVGGKFSWVSPFYLDQVERTLAHELGHNDGFSHHIDEYNGLSPAQKNNRLSAYSTGHHCGSYSSIMRSGVGNRSEGFFSSPLVKNAQGTECGVEEEADSARAYREAVAYHIPNQAHPFRNNKPARQASGTVSISVISTIVNEGEPIIIDINWAGAEVGDSVQVLTRKGSADISDFQSTLESVYYDGESAFSQVQIATFEDGKFELDETMSVELIFPHGVNIDGTSKQTITIVSNDDGQSGLVDFSTDALTLNQGQSSNLTLQRTGGADGELTVSVSTHEDTATESNFFPIDREITFADGETSKVISVRARSNPNQVGSKTFFVRVSGQDQIIGTTSEVLVTINEPTPPANDEPERQAASSSPLMILSLIIIGILMRLPQFRAEREV